MLSKLRQSPQTRQELLQAAALFAGVSVFFFFYCASLLMSECAGHGTRGGQRTTETQFSPPTLSVPENELRSSGLRGSDFNH